MKCDNSSPSQRTYASSKYGLLNSQQIDKAYFESHPEIQHLYPRPAELKEIREQIKTDLPVGVKCILFVSESGTKPFYHNYLQ